MIHSGAIIGAGIPQFRSIVVKFINFPYPYFRSDRFIAAARRLCMHNNSLKMHLGISVTLCLAELLLEWQLPLGLPLEGYCSA